MVKLVTSVIIMLYLLYKLGNELDKSTKMAVVLPIIFGIIMDLVYMLAILANMVLA